MVLVDMAVLVEIMLLTLVVLVLLTFTQPLCYQLLETTVVEVQHLKRQTLKLPTLLDLVL
jgi:hypothetical protein